MGLKRNVTAVFMIETLTPSMIAGSSGEDPKGYRGGAFEI
jgi:hypothetical protein